MITTIALRSLLRRVKRECKRSGRWHGGGIERVGRKELRMGMINIYFINIQNFIRIKSKLKIMVNVFSSQYLNMKESFVIIRNLKSS